MTYTEAKEAINEIGRRELEKLIEQYGEEAVNACVSLGISLSDFEEAYQGEYSSDENFAQELAEQLGEIDRNAHWPHNCIDWEHAAKELMYDYAEENGHYFRNL